MRTEQEYKNLEEAKDATIAQQAEQLAALTLALENSENRHVFEAPEGMCFMPENTPDQLSAAQKDARRYRWLSSNSKHIKWIPSNYNKDVVSGFSAFGTGYLGFGFEEAIDAAIAAQEVKS